MSDKTFEWSLTTLSILAILWMVLGSIFLYWVLGIAAVIIIGLVVWIVGGGALLYYWGKDYMAGVSVFFTVCKMMAQVSHPEFRWSACLKQVG